MRLFLANDLKCRFDGGSESEFAISLRDVFVDCTHDSIQPLRVPGNALDRLSALWGVGRWRHHVLTGVGGRDGYGWIRHMKDCPNAPRCTWVTWMNAWNEVERRSDLIASAFTTPSSQRSRGGAKAASLDLVLLVILGAGASFDSVHSSNRRAGADTSWPPPLARELFDPRPNFLDVINDFPACRPLLALLRARVGDGEDVEVLLEELIERSEQGETQLPRQLMAVRFYLRQVIERCGRNWFNLAAGITNYHRLVNTIETWRAANDERVTFVTFNYDRMLEDAFRDTVNIPFVGIEDYTCRDDYWLIKPHGSVDWGREVGHTDFFPGGIGDVIDKASDLDESDRVVVTDGSMRRAGGEVQAAPAIAIPTRTKTRFQCPPDHVDALKEGLREVDWVLVIGWRGQEQYFLDLCKEGLHPGTRLLVVDENKENADGIRAQLHEVLSQTRTAASVHQGFSALVWDEAFLDYLTGGTIGEPWPSQETISV